MEAQTIQQIIKPKPKRILKVECIDDSMFANYPKKSYQPSELIVGKEYQVFGEYDGGTKGKEVMVINEKRFKFWYPIDIFQVIKYGN